MMTAYQNKRIAKALGRCWHDWYWIAGGGWRCKNCPIDIYDPNNPTYERRMIKPENIPFDTWEGFHLIIENGPKQEWWRDFVLMSPKVFELYKSGWAVKQDFIGPKLAIALNEWLEKEKK